MLGLVVVLVEFGSVLLGGKGHVQGNLNLLHLGIVEVHGGQAGLPALNLMQIGGNNVSQPAQALAVIGGLQLLLLVGQLAADAGELIRQGLVEGLGAGAHSLGQGSAGVEVVQQV